VALKETLSSLDLDGGVFEELFNEFTILRQLRHPNIVKLLGTYESASHGRAFLVTVFAENGTLSQYYRQSFHEVTLAQRRKWMLDIATALVYVAPFY